MRYHILHIETSFAEEWQKEVFDQTLCDLGVDTIDNTDYYIPSEVWETQSDAIEAFLFETEGALLVSAEACPDENWNAVWEAEHPVQELPMGVRIVPHCAFGAGHHETTSLMIEALMERYLDGKIVLDNGTGTGVLAIFAKKMGAAHVLAVDVDDKSVTNAKENAVLNEIEIEAVLGDLSYRPFREGLEPGSFDLIVANIHRNILLDQMPVYAHLLRGEGEVWMSGFYETDCPALQAAAEAEGLTLMDVLANGEWRLMRCRKEERPLRR